MQNLLFSQLALSLQQWRNCRGSHDNIWQLRSSAIIDALQGMLPSGSGIDSGAEIMRDACKPDKLVIRADFHHMDENGYYDGWTQHTIIVKPSFDGIEIKVTGRNRNDIKEYLAEIFYYALKQDCTETIERVRASWKLPA